MVFRKVAVSPGIFWVEVAEADLRVLCGCPADSVKHLIRRGLIVPQEVKGVVAETGPNAILLCDTALQNGEFANLSEFPVLQMLYRQGILIPGHPNNNGQKPILIGSADQIASQLEYITRGNYGLISRDEILQAGMSEEQATEMMRLKLKFAFGKIRLADEFVESRPVADGEVEIKNGVMIRRKQLNLFEFSYQGETLEVALELPPGESYRMPYPLGLRKFDPSYFSVIHSGDGDGWDVDRPQMSSIITHQTKIYLVDAGPNVGRILTSLGIGIDQVDGIFHTHVHDDHFAGLTALMRAGKRIKYCATRLVRHSTMKKLAALVGIEGQFNDFFEVQDLVFDTWQMVDGLEVMAVFSPHPVETNTLYFRALSGDGYKTYAHLADIASLSVLKNMVTDDATAPGLSAETFERIRQSYLMPCDLKKIDIGGGMIHGSAIDFQEDKSGRLLLSHRATSLTAQEREIGSSSVFGAVDVLIEGETNSFLRHAYDYLTMHLPGVPDHYLRLLLNQPNEEINAGSILLREGEAPKEMLLLLSGHVERIRTSSKIQGRIEVGTLIGDSAILDGRLSNHTYRASSFIRVLRIPVGLYVEVVNRNGLLDRVKQIVDFRVFLATTSLFSDCLPVRLLGGLIDRSRERTLAEGEVIEGRDIRMIGIVRSGNLDKLAEGRTVEKLGPGQSFGEEVAVLNVPALYNLKATEKTAIVQLPGDLIAEIPALRWKIFERFQYRVSFQSV